MTTQLYDIMIISCGVMITAMCIYCHNRALAESEKVDSFSYSEIPV